MASLALSYSDALYEIASEESKTEAYLKQLCFVEEQLCAHQDFFRILKHPGILKEQKKQSLTEVFGKELEHTVLNFLKLLIDKGRFREIPEITKEFAKRYRKENNIVIAYVTSAEPLSEKESKRISEMLEKKLSKKIELKLSVDKELIAGIRIKLNDLVLDYTALGHLEQLKHLAVISNERKESEGEGE